MKIYVSTSCLINKYGFLQVLDIYNELGIRNVELGVFIDHNANVVKLLKQYNFNYIVHHYFPPLKNSFIINLASQNKQILKKSIDQIFRSINFCNDYNIKIFSFHAGFRVDPDMNLKFDLNNIIEYQTSFNTFKESVLKIADYAEKKDVKVAIENNVLSKYNLVDGRNKLLLMCEAWEFKKLFQEIKSENLGILLDLGHLKVTSNILKFNANNFIENLKNKIFLVHIHENDGEVDEHECIKKGDWSLKVTEKYFKSLDIPVVLECKCNSKKELENILKILKGTIKTFSKRFKYDGKPIIGLNKF